MAPAKKVTRKELRQPDEFVSFTRQTLVFLQFHKRAAFVSGAFVAGALLLIIGWQWYFALTSVWADRGFQQALSAYRTSEYQRAAAHFSEVASLWPKTASGQLASFYLGHCYVKLESYAKAIEIYKDFLETTSKNGHLYQLTLVSLALASEGGGDDVAAHSFYSQAASLSGPFTGEALLGKARLYEKLGDSVKATGVYQDFLSRYPDSPLEPMLEAKIAVAVVSSKSLIR